LLRDFPGRTEADLYLWVSEHRSALEEQLGWEVRHEAAISDLATRSSPRPMRVVTRILDRLRDLMTPDELELGPPPGQWRRDYLGARQESQLFADLLVAVNGQESGWHALQQALEIAWREGAKLHGLYVVPKEADRDRAQAVREEFERRCREANVSGRLVVEVGKVARLVSDRSRWTDLIVLALAHPPGVRLLARLQSGIRTIIKRSSRAVLVVPEKANLSRFERALLAYNGSAKSEEALFIATYLAGKHHMSLTVLMVSENRAAAQKILDHAQNYIEEHGVQAEFVIRNGFVADAIFRALDEYQADLLLIGGYKTQLWRVLQGNVLDRVLSKSQKPMLIAR
jgi:nucleotide-binding universal stress UspA family protein